MIIVGLFVLSLSMFVYSMNRYQTFRLLRNDEKEKYILISKKEKIDRTEEEQDFYLQTQESFYSLLIAKYSFWLVILLIIIYESYLLIIK